MHGRLVAGSCRAKILVPSLVQNPHWHGTTRRQCCAQRCALHAPAHALLSPTLTLVPCYKPVLRRGSPCLPNTTTRARWCRRRRRWPSAAPGRWQSPTPTPKITPPRSAPGGSAPALARGAATRRRTLLLLRRLLKPRRRRAARPSRWGSTGCVFTCLPCVQCTCEWRTWRKCCLRATFWRWLQPRPLYRLAVRRYPCTILVISF